MRIVFMGTPDFAVAALQKLLETHHKIVGVITAPDQPAGRGKKTRMSAVKEFALKHDLKILQPLKLKDEEFIQELKELQADIQVVVAFRMLPEIVWNMPPKGTFNLHASLLPQYRGAAPINHAIINGEKETGVTTFFLDKEIDTGRIILQRKCTIEITESAGTLHDKLMVLGAELIIETLQRIEENNYETIDQIEFFVDEGDLKSAPKIFKPDCELDWSQSAENINNKIRGLSPYPAAYTHLQSALNDDLMYLKIFKAEIIPDVYPNLHIGEIHTDSKKILHAKTGKGILSIQEVQLEGKKRMDIENFLRGFNLAAPCSFKTLI